MANETFYGRIVGQVFRGRRELLQINLKEMAKAMGVNSSAWSRVETGDTTMTVTQLRVASAHLKRAPWSMIQQADEIAAKLARHGVAVHSKKEDVKELARALNGSGILALFALGELT